MGKLLEIVGNIVAILGILGCLAAGGSRLTGAYYLFGYESNSLFIGCTGLMVMGCLAKLHALSSK